MKRSLQILCTLFALFFSTSCLAQNTTISSLKFWEMPDPPEGTSFYYKLLAEPTAQNPLMAEVKISSNFSSMTIEISKDGQKETLVLNKAGTKYEKGQITLNKEQSSVALVESKLLPLLERQLEELETYALPTAAATYIKFLGLYTKPQAAAK